MSDTTQLTSIFVYGTLKRHGARHHLWPFPPVRIVDSRIRGSLHDLGPYPALSLTGSGWVGGERWEIAPEDLHETLEALDTIEGYQHDSDDLYRRCRVECHDMDGAIHTAFAYEFAQPDRLIGTNRIPANGDGVSSWPIR